MQGKRFHCAHCQTPMRETAAVAETAPGQVQAVSYCKMCGAYVWSESVLKGMLLTEAFPRVPIGRPACPEFESRGAG